MEPEGDDVDEDPLAAVQKALRETEELMAQARQLTEKRDAGLVDFEVQLGRALRKGQRHDGAHELRSLLHKHAAQGRGPAVSALDKLAGEDPWWSQEK